MKKILIVDDEVEIRDLIKDFLDKNNFETDTASNGKEALEKLSLQYNNISLVILDIMMPEIDGMEVIKQIRKTSNIPVIFLTSKNEEIDKVLGLEIGADDYITKPFNPREMVARIKAVLRRSEQSSKINQINQSQNQKETPSLQELSLNLQKNNDNTINTNNYNYSNPSNINNIKSDFKNINNFSNAENINNIDTNKLNLNKIIKIYFNSTNALGRKRLSSLEINPQAYRVFINNKEAKFTHKQYQLLLYLIQNKNIVLSREKILEAVWGFDFSGETRTVDVHIKELRKKIGDIHGELIETIWAIGYRFNYDKEIN
jgi:DNA-binding response OmpR family regulator